MRAGNANHARSGPERHARSGPARHARSGPGRHARSGPGRHARSGPARHARGGPARLHAQHAARPYATCSRCFWAHRCEPFFCCRPFQSPSRAVGQSSAGDRLKRQSCFILRRRSPTPCVGDVRPRGGSTRESEAVGLDSWCCLRFGVQAQLAQCLLLRQEANFRLLG
jgi:hypothetical protein